MLSDDESLFFRQKILKKDILNRVCPSNLGGIDYPTRPSWAAINTLPTLGPSFVCFHHKITYILYYLANYMSTLDFAFNSICFAPLFLITRVLFLLTKFALLLGNLIDNLLRIFKFLRFIKPHYGDVA